MTLAELIDEVRRILDDRVLPCLVPDEDIVRLLNNAVEEACLRTRVIQDSTSAVTAVALEPDEERYHLDASIYAVRRVVVGGERLQLVDTAQLDEMHPGWDAAPSGRPKYAVFDYGTGEMLLHPAPAQADTARLLVWRRPTEDERLDVSDPTAEPALPEMMHRGLVHWAAAHAALSPDQDVLNGELYAAQSAMFEAEYGRKPTLHEVRLWSTNKRRHVRAVWD